KGLRIGIPKEYFGEGLDPEIREAIEATKAKLIKSGAKLVDVSLPHSKYCVADYYILTTAEASSNLARFDGIRYGVRTSKTGSLEETYRKSRAEGFGKEVKRRI